MVAMVNPSESELQKPLFLSQPSSAGLKFYYFQFNFNFKTSMCVRV